MRKLSSSDKFDGLSFLTGLAALTVLLMTRKFYGAAAVGVILAAHASILVRRYF